MGSSLEEALEVMGVVGGVTVPSTGNATHVHVMMKRTDGSPFLDDAPALAARLLLDLLGLCGGA